VEVSYYLGIAYDGLGDERHARTMYEQAMLFASNAPRAASLRLAELLARKGELTSAGAPSPGEFCGPPPDDLRVMEELVCCGACVGK